MFLCGVFFFFKQKTAYEITTGDWSSDVCSSDLRHRTPRREPRRRRWPGGAPGSDRKSVVSGKSVGCCVDLGGRRIIQKKNTQEAPSLRVEAPLERSLIPHPRR